MATASSPPTSLLPLLRQIPLFAELDDAALMQLAQRCVPRSVPTGRILFTTGEECRGLYMIESGRVRIYRTNPEGREQIIHIEGPGRAVAELPLFDGGAYPASAVTVEESRRSASCSRPEVWRTLALHDLVADRLQPTF